MRSVLLAALLVFGASAFVRAEEPTELQMGRYRLQAEVIGRDGPFLRVRLGTATYDLERRSIAGEEPLDPERLAFVRELLRRVGHPDASLDRAARAGLAALGEAARPYLAAVARAEGLAAKLELLGRAMSGGEARPAPEVRR